jgi:hypothetical protein
MEEHLYVLLKRNWNYLHPISRIIARVDYYLEKMWDKIKNRFIIKQLRYKLTETWRIKNWFVVRKSGTIRNRHWYE